MKNTYYKALLTTLCFNILFVKDLAACWTGQESKYQEVLTVMDPLGGQEDLGRIVEDYLSPADLCEMISTTMASHIPSFDSKEIEMGLYVKNRVDRTTTSRQICERKDLFMKMIRHLTRAIANDDALMTRTCMEMLSITPNCRLLDYYLDSYDKWTAKDDHRDNNYMNKTRLSIRQISQIRHLRNPTRDPKCQKVHALIVDLDEQYGHDHRNNQMVEKMINKYIIQQSLRRDFYDYRRITLREAVMIGAITQEEADQREKEYELRNQRV